MNDTIGNTTTAIIYRWCGMRKDGLSFGLLPHQGTCE